VASLYDVMNQMKTIFENSGYTVYFVNEFHTKNIQTLDSASFPIICMGRQIEEIDNDESPVDYIDSTAIIDLNIVLNTGKENLEADAATILRDIKTIVYTNNSNQYWCNWVVVDNFIAQLANTNENSKVFGGININCSVEYRELKIA